MPRTRRQCPAGYIYHVLNRSVARITLFRHDKDYAAFELTLAQAHARTPIDLLAYCVMSNHWHLVLRPRPLDRRTPIQLDPARQPPPPRRRRRSPPTDHPPLPPLRRPRLATHHRQAPRPRPQPPPARPPAETKGKSPHAIAPRPASTFH